jgi:hypothetical protein
MTKIFEDLLHEADVSEFVKNTKIEEEEFKPTVLKPVVLPAQDIQITDPNVPSRPAKTFFGLKDAMTGQELLERRAKLEGRGEFEAITTPEEHGKDVAQRMEGDENTMWNIIDAAWGEKAIESEKRIQIVETMPAKI